MRCRWSSRPASIYGGHPLNDLAGLSIGTLVTGGLAFDAAGRDLDVTARLDASGSDAFATSLSPVRIAGDVEFIGGSSSVGSPYPILVSPFTGLRGTGSLTIRDGAVFNDPQFAGPVNISAETLTSACIPNP